MKEDQWVETNSTGQVLAVTLNGDSIDDVISMTVNNTALDPIKDHLGSVYGWTNANTGTVVQKQSYSAYGDTTIEQSSILFGELGAIRGFASRELDLTTNLYFNRARYYDPGSGRFLSEDPIGFDGGDENLYRYVFNNPPRYNDPSGLRLPPLSSITGTNGQVIGAGLGGLLGGAVGGPVGGVAGGIAGSYIGGIFDPGIDPNSDKPNATYNVDPNLHIPSSIPHLPNQPASNSNMCSPGNGPAIRSGR